MYDCYNRSVFWLLFRWCCASIFAIFWHWRYSLSPFVDLLSLRWICTCARFSNYRLTHNRTFTTKGHTRNLIHHDNSRYCTLHMNRVITIVFAIHIHAFANNVQTKMIAACRCACIKVDTLTKCLFSWSIHKAEIQNRILSPIYIHRWLLLSTLIRQLSKAIKVSHFLWFVCQLSVYSAHSLFALKCPFFHYMPRLRSAWITCSQFSYKT